MNDKLTKNSIQNSFFKNDFYDYREKRAALREDKYKWKKFPIEYEVIPGLQRDNIYYALKNIMSESCLTFKEKINFKNEGLKFVNSFESVTRLGKSKNKRPNIIYLTQLDNFKSNIIIPLIFRALGIDYEFNRFDRNKYIKINKKNIKPGYKNILDTSLKKSAHTYGLHYDYKSIMQLSNEQVALANKTVFETKNKNYQKTLQVRSNPSFNDYKLLNLHYCKKTCKKSDLKKECKNYGYQNPKNCSQCKCPPSFMGMYCETFKNISRGNCGKLELEAKPFFKTLKLESFSMCYYKIKAKKGKKIEIKLPNGILGDPYLCSLDINLEIMYSKDKSITGAIFCDKVQKSKLKSGNNIVFVKWKYSRRNVTYSLQYKEIRK
uniref:Metalloendopeptidase n=1 Tax=Strongyloides stercoralis TaxID=6248 RepID=A0AAF5HZX5_STRER